MIDRVVDPIGHRAVATAMAGLPSTSTPCARPSRPLWTRAAALGALAVTAPPLLVLLHGFREPTPKLGVVAPKVGVLAPKLLDLLAQSLDHFGVRHTDPLQYLPPMGQLFCERPTTAEQLRMFDPALKGHHRAYRGGFRNVSYAYGVCNLQTH